MLNIERFILKGFIVLFLSAANIVLALSPEETATKNLLAAGYDGVNIKVLNNEVLCSFEQGNFRRKSDDLKNVYTILKSIYTDTLTYKIFLKENGQATYQYTSLKNVETSEKTLKTIDTVCSENIDYYTYSDYMNLKDSKVNRPNSKVIWLVLYPQITFRNNIIDPIYEKQINIAPAIKYSAWKGMLLTGQIIFPVINELEYHDNFIRPGFVTFSQTIQFKNNYNLQFTLGNFNKNRYGVDIVFKKNFRDSRINFTANMGYTGQIYIYDRYLNIKPINTLSYNIKAYYYYPKLQVQTSIQLGQFIYNDKGIRVEIYRNFGETAIGFYAYYSENNWNGGFNYSIPIGAKKRKKSGAFRVVLPSHFDTEYNYKSDLTYGRYYETNPDENRSTQNLHSKLIQNLFINP